jgi:hypothetical protein
MTSNSLSAKAMLVSVNIRQWGGFVHDKSISREVAEQHSSDIELGRFHKHLVDKGALRPVVSAAGAIRTWFYEQTLPWASDGARILPSANYFPFCEGMRERRAAFDSAVAEFVAAYEDHKAEARRRLNGLYDERNYPTAQQIERRFASDVHYDNLPDAADWRVALGDEEESRIRADIERRGAEAIAAAQASLWERCFAVCSAMVDRLSNYSVAVEYETAPDGKRKRKQTTTGGFRDSLVENARELVNLLPRLNVTGSAELEATRQRIEAELCGYEAQTLRDNDTVRASVAKSAADILASMSGYVGDMANAAE